MVCSTSQKNTFGLAAALVALLVFVVFVQTAMAQSFNQQINYQGKLTDNTGSTVADGAYNVAFALYDAESGGTQVWVSTTTVNVVSGLFSYMLGSSTSLTGVDFNQTLYLGVNIGGTGAPTWDGEMSPRKIIGAVPAAFEAGNAQTLDGIATSSFLRSDQADEIAATTASTLLTITQNGSGDILNLFDGGTEVVTVTETGQLGLGTSSPASTLDVWGDMRVGTSGVPSLFVDVSTNRVGIGTSTPSANLTVVGDMHLTGAFRDSSDSPGTDGFVLLTTATGTRWVATSTLGFGDSLFTDGGATTFLIDTTDNFAIGLTSTDAKLGIGGNISLVDTSAMSGIDLNGASLITGSTTLNNFFLAGATSSNQWSGAGYNFAIGNGSMQYLTSGDQNFAVGQNALRGSTTAGMTGVGNAAIGALAMEENFVGNYNNAFGYAALNENTVGSYNNALGFEALALNTSGDGNNAFGREALESNTTGSNNISIGDFSLQQNAVGSENIALGYSALNANLGTGTIAIGNNVADNATAVDRGIFIGHNIDAFSATANDVLNIGNLIFGTNVDGTGTTISTGNIGIGTSTPESRLSVWGNLTVATSGIPTLFADTANQGVAIGTTSTSQQGSNNGRLKIVGSARFGANADAGVFVDLTQTTTASAPLTGMRTSLVTADDGYAAGQYNVLDFTPSTASDNSELVGVYSSVTSSSSNTANITSGVENNLTISGGAGYGLLNLLRARNDNTAGTLYGGLNIIETHSNDVGYGTLVLDSYAPLGYQSTGGTQYGVYVDLGTAGLAGNSIYVATGSLPSYFGSAVGIGTSSPTRPFTVATSTYITGALYDNTNSAGTNGMVLQTTGTGFSWVSTSSLGIQDDLSDNVLSDLSNVDDTNVLAGDLLQYTGAGWATTSTSTLGLLADANDSITPNNVQSGSQVDEYCLTYEGTGSTWEWQDCSGGAINLGELGDVNTTGVSGGDILVYNGTNWVDFSTSTFLMESEIDTEAELESFLTDVSDVFTSNDTIASTSLAAEVIVASEIDTSAELAGILTDETGDGALTFSNNSVFTGTTTFARASTSELVLNQSVFTSLTGAGLSNNSGALTIASDAITPDMVHTTGQTDEYCLTYEGTGTTWEWQDCSAGSINLADLGDVNTTNAATGTLLVYNGTSWATTSTSSLNINTDDLTEGTNLFYTDARVATYIGASTTILNENTEAGLEAFLTDVTNVFTNNDTIDISANTNLAVTGTGIELSDDTVTLSAGYSIPLTASTSEWTTFYNTPSSRISAGTGLTWAGNTINLDNDFGASIDESELNIAGGPTDGYVLQASSTSAGGFVWVATSSLNINGEADDLSDNVLADLSDVNTTNVLAGDLLQYTGAGWATTSTSSLNINTDDLTEGTNLFFTNARFDARLAATTSLPNLTTLATLATVGTITTGVWQGTDIDGQYIATSTLGLGDGFLGGLRDVDTTNVASGDLLQYTGSGWATTSTSSLGLTSPWNQNGSFVYYTGGTVGVGTTTPQVELAIDGDLQLTGGMFDNNNTRGTNGQILQTTGSGVVWTSTSSLGLLADANDSITPNNVQSGSQVDEYCLTYEGTGSTWEWQDCSGGAINLGELGDVNTTGVSGGDILVYNGTNWVDFSTSTFLMESEIDTEAELESFLTDVSDVFTSNDTIASTSLAAEVIVASEIDTSAELAGILTDETGDGALTFSNNSVFTGTTTFARASTSELVLNQSVFTSLTGAGLSNNSGALTIASDAITPDMVHTTGQTDEYCLTYEGTGTTWEWQDCSAGSINLADLGDVNTTNAATGTLLVYNGTSWATTSTSSLNINTDDLTEGTNLFFTNARFDARLAATTSLPNLTTLATLATVGTITTGVWQGSDIDGQYIATSTLGLGDGFLGGLRDVDTTNVASGDLLQYTGSGWATTSTSSLGITSASFGTDNQVPYTNAGGTDFDYSSNFLFDGTSLGIGTSNTDRLINVAGATNPGARFTDTTNTVALDLRAENFQGFMGTFSNHDLRFVTNNSSRMTIDTNGDVGMGTTSPASRLDVWGDLRVGTSGTPVLLADPSDSSLRFGFLGSPGLTGLLYTDANGVVSTTSTSTLGLLADANDSISPNNVQSGSQVDEYCLTYEGTGSTWEWQDCSGGAINLGELGDVNTTGVSGGDILVYNGTNWVDFSTSTFLMESELNTFSELDTLVADKNLANLDDAQTFTSLITFTGNASTSNFVISGTATTTNLVIGGDNFNTLTGDGLSISGNALVADLGTSIDESELNIAGGPTDGYVLQASSTAAGGFAWVATSSLGITGGITGTEGYAVTFDSSGNQVATSSLFFASNGNIGIGSTTPEGRLAIHNDAVSGAQVAGIRQYLNVTNSTLNDIIYGDNTYIDMNNTATTTMVGGIIRIADNTTLGNNVQGFQVQTNRGANTLGENTAIAGFGRTFGVKGVTEGDAGGVAEPAGVFAETRGTIQGNALRAFTEDLTTGDLVSFFQASSTFSGDGLVMDFGNTTGSFSGNFLNLQDANTTLFRIDSDGTIHSSSTATSTFENGINLSSGCFAVNGSCIGGAAATALNDLTDVTTTNAATGTLISYTGSAWATTSTSTLNIDAVTLDSLDSTQFLRSDTADTASGLLTFTGGFVSSASSTASLFNFGTATGTTLVLGGDVLTDFTGTGLSVTSGVLNVGNLATSSLNIAGTYAAGSLLQASTTAAGGYVWAATSTLGLLADANDSITPNNVQSGSQVDEYCLTYEGTGSTWEWQDCSGGAINLGELGDVNTTGVSGGDILVYNGTNWVDFSTSTFLMESEIDTEAELESFLTDVSDVFTSNDTIASTSLAAEVIVASEIDTSAELAGILTDETGDGALTFSNNSVFTGTTTFARASTSELVLNQSVFTSLTGAGLSNNSGALTIASDAITPDMVHTTGQTDEYCLTYEGTGTTWEWQDCSGGAINLGDLSDVNTTGALTGALLSYTGSGWATTSTSSLGLPTGDTVVTVAANDTPASEKDNADFVADGTADEVQIQAAIDSLGATGGKVELLPGTFNIAATINLATSTHLSGAGASSTKLVASAGSLDIVDTAGPYGAISKLHFDADSQSSVDGIKVQDSDVQMFDNTFVNFDGNNLSRPVYVNTFGENAAFVNNRVIGSNEVYFESAANLLVVGNYIDGQNNGTPQGLMFTSVDHANISDNNISNVQYGIQIYAGGGNSVVNDNVIENNEYHVYIDIADDVMFSNNYFGSSTFSAIDIETGADGISVHDNVFDSAGQSLNSTTGVVRVGDSDVDYLSIKGNTFRDRTSVASTPRPAISVPSGGVGHVFSGNSIQGSDYTMLAYDLSTGAEYNEFNRRTLATADQVGYNLFNITGSSSVALASLTQQGTGDIFELLDTAGDTVFIADASGNVGIGTTTNLTRKLTVADDLSIRGTDPVLYLDDTDYGGGRPGVRFTNNDLMTFAGDDSGTDTQFNFYSVFSDTRTTDASLRVFGDAAGDWGNYISMGHTGAGGFGNIATDVGEIKIDPGSTYGIELIGTTTITASSPGESVGDQGILNFNPAGGYSAGVRSRLISSEDRAFIDYYTESDGTGSWIFGNQFGTQEDILKIAGNTGYVGIGTTSPRALLTVGSSTSVALQASELYNSAYIAGSLEVDGVLYDTVNDSAGTNGMVLQTTGTGFEWVATSTLGLGGGGGASAFTALSDVEIGSLSANRIIFASSTGSALTDSANFVFDGITFAAPTSTISGLLTLSGTAANLAIGANFINNDGVDDEGISIGADGNVVINDSSASDPAALQVIGDGVHIGAGGTINYANGGGDLYIQDELEVDGNTFIDGQLNMEGSSSNISLGDNWLSGDGGDEGIYITGSGLVGIDTTAPMLKFQVNDANGGNMLLVRDDTGVSANDMLGGLGFDGIDGNVPADITHSAASIIGYAAEDHSATDKGGYLTFWTSPIDQDDDTAGFERMRLDDQGNVGIGTTSPSSKLSVYGDAFLEGTDRYLNFGTATGTGGYGFRDNGGTMEFKNSGGGWATIATSGQASLFTANGSTTYLTALNDNLGVGTTSAVATFAVDGTSRFTNEVTLQDSTGDTPRLTFTGSGSSSAIYMNGSRELIFESPESMDFISTNSGATNETFNMFKVSQSNRPGDMFFRLWGDGTGNEYLELSHNGFDGRIQTGAGDLSLESFTKRVAINETSPDAIFEVSGDGLADDLFFISSTDDADGDIFSILNNGNVGIGTTSPASKLDVWGDFRVGTGSVPTLFTDVSTGRVGIGTTTPGAALSVEGNIIATGVMQAQDQTNDDFTRPALGLIRKRADNSNPAAGFGTGIDFQIQGANDSIIPDAGFLRVFWENAQSNDTTDRDTAMVFALMRDNTPFDVARFTSDGNFGIGTSSPTGKLGIEQLNVSGSNAIAGIDTYYGFENSVDGAVVYGNRGYIMATNTATTTMVGQILRLEDATTFGNTVRGLEVQVNRGGNTAGENTALSGFARTFGVRGFTSGDAGASFEPAGGFFESGGTSQGNAIRGFSETITTADLLSLFHSSSTFEGTGLAMDFGNGTGSFASTTASRFIDLQNAGNSQFIVYHDGRTQMLGTTTIGASTTATMASLHIHNGGLCVDNDGYCEATTTGKITAVAYGTANSDLAEMYFSSDDLLPGELVVSDNFLSVERATEDQKENILGVISTKPGMTLGFDDSSLVAGQKGYPLALTGRVPVRLSNENGNIEPGDPLTLSSIPGVAMKATGADVVVGTALEYFNGTRAYTDGFVDQFGDDIAKPNYSLVPELREEKTKADCYFGGGVQAGDEDENCNPDDFINNLADDTGATAEEVAQARYEAEMAALEALKEEPAEYYTVDGETVAVGQVIMFVDRGYNIVPDQLALLNELTSTSTDLVLGAEEGSDETLWSRLKVLAQGFVDGVLAVAGIKTDKVETSELCVDDVCVTADDLRALLDGTTPQAEATTTGDSDTDTTETGTEENETGSDDTEPEPAGDNSGEEQPVATSSDNATSTSSPEENTADTSEETATEETDAETNTASSTEPESSPEAETGGEEAQSESESTETESTTPEETASETTEESETAAEEQNEPEPEPVAEEEPEPEVIEEEPEPEPEPEPVEEPAQTATENPAE